MQIKVPKCGEATINSYLLNLEATATATIHRKIAQEQNVIAQSVSYVQILKY